MLLQLRIYIFLMVSLTYFSLSGQTFNNGTNTSIPDCGSQVCSSINVSGLPSTIDGTFGLEQVCIKINHTWDADLDIFLVAPDGTTVELSTDNGGSSDDYGSGSNNNSGPYTCFDMTGGTAITAGTAPFTSGPYTPEGNLGDVNNGQNPNGTWQLCVTDDGCGDNGFINYWELTFGNNPAPPSGGGSAPTNDNCSNATTMNCGDNLTSQTTVGATANGSSTGCTLGMGVWYSFTPVSTQSVTVTATPEAGYDIELAIASGSCSSMANVACEDAGLSGDPETVTFTASAGVTYYFYVAHYSSSSSTTGAFDISLSCSAPCSSPSNDDCSGATAVTVGTFNGGCTNTVSGTVNCATQSSQSTSACSGTEDDDVWYSFVAPASGTVNIDLLNVSGSTTDLYHSVWSGSCPTLSLVSGSCSDPNSSTLSGLTPGQTYYVRVYTWTSTTGQNTTFDICIEDGTCPSTPSNDECSGATPVTVNTSGCTSTANGAVNCATQTTSPANSSSCFGTADDDVWFSFTAPATGAVSINLQNISGSTTDLYHSVWSGTCPSLTLVSGTCSDPNSQQVTSLTPGQTYYLRVYTYTSTSGQTTTFDVCISEIDACGSNGTNDFCEDAATLSPGGSFLSNTTSAYTVDAPGNLNSEFCGALDNNSWYQFTATSTTETFNFNTVANCANADGIQAEVYSVTTDANGCCSNFTSMSNCWNPTTQTSGTVTATGLTVGQTYYLMVDGYAGDQCDFEVLGWSSTPVLPVELISFTGKPIAEGNLLKWATATEINNKAFFIERSVDGHLFETIGRVEGNGNSNVINNYSYIDENVAPTSTFYYRLKQMDYDGKISYSDVIVINRNDAVIDIYPNPSDDNFYLNLQNIDEQNITIKIYDVVGKEIYSSTGNISSNSQTINLSNEINLPKGIYFIAVYNNQNEKIFFEQIIRK